MALEDSLMIDRMLDRCRRICGRADVNCYINSKEQINCITDMVINKTSGISMILGLSLNENDLEATELNIRESIAAANELSNWFKHLQMVKDLRVLSSLVLDADAGEKRNEIRFPLPDELRDMLKAELTTEDGPLQVTVINASQSGMQLLSPSPAERGSTLKFTITMGQSERKERYLIDIMYCKEGDKGYFIGARIKDLSGSMLFNFYNDICGFITESNVFFGERFL